MCGAPMQRVCTGGPPLTRKSLTRLPLTRTAKNILGIAHPKHSILLMVGRFLEGNLGYFALLVASNKIYFL